MERRQSTFQETVKKGFYVLIFELFGSAWLALFQRYFGGILLVFSYWILLALGDGISGSHYNPAVTVAWMFRK